MDDSMEEICAMAKDSHQVPHSPKPTAFTIDFDVGKAVDTQRHKSLVEKYQRRHCRGQSLSKLEDMVTMANPVPKKPQSAHLPRKSSIMQHPESTSSIADSEPCEEKSDESKSNYKLRDTLTLPLKNVHSNRMTQSCTLPCIDSPDIDDVSTPELEALRPSSPIRRRDSQILLTPDNDRIIHDSAMWVSSGDFDFDKSDAVSDAGTYTLDADAYSEEQKARMSIDRDFKIEAVSNLKKAQDYVQSLAIANSRHLCEKIAIDESLDSVNCFFQNKLSPIVSPTQHFSINSEPAAGPLEYSKTLNKILFPSPKARVGIGSEKTVDQGCVISVTSSGAFRPRIDKAHARRMSLTKSDIHVEAFADNKHIGTEIQRPSCTLSASLVYVGDHNGHNGSEATQPCAKVLNLPPRVGGLHGKASPTKIPSPVHSARPQSRNSSNSLNIDLSDSSMETESYLRPTETLLNTLQQRLSIESDAESEDGAFLNNDARNILKNASHLRHNSLDERFLKISNKLEHFHNKMFIDQTNVLNQCAHHNRVQHKIQNSPTSSPIRRSSSFSANNQIKAKCTNVQQRETNIRNAPGCNRNGSIQRSASTAAVRSTFCRMPCNEPHKIDRSQYGDTESSSEEDMLQSSLKKKDITATRYNRAFSLRRARLDDDPGAITTAITSSKCPNTPEMRRKFQSGNGRSERAISVDRKPIAKAADVHSRYMQNLSRSRAPSQSKTTPNMQHASGNESIKCSPKTGNTATKPAPKAQVFSRSDAGRFSMRTNKPPMTNSQKTIRREVNLGHKKATGPRSNSSLTSKEVEFQNWKRRKSYDPMKAAAEGKRKAEMARKQNVNTMTQSYHESNQDCDSSPSHSSSVHRSQSFHGTAALGHYLTSDDEEDELTLSADEGFSPPTPSPCEMSPTKTKPRYAWSEH